MRLSILGELSWWVTIVILVREVGITVWRLVELRRGNVVPASSGGKLKTLAQSIAISLALLPLWTVVGDWIYWVNGVDDGGRPRAHGVVGAPTCATRCGWPRGPQERWRADARPDDLGAGASGAPASPLPLHSCTPHRAASRSRSPSR